LKIEYLLIKTDNDFCSTTEQFKSLLLSNKRISMNETSIQFSGVSLGFTLTEQAVVWKKKKEIIFYFSVSAEEDNIDKLEDFDILLHRINDNCGCQFIINTIWDDVSVYYTNQLYPSMVEVENLLRKVIYRFMIKTAGSAWFENTVPNDVKAAILKAAEKNRMEELPLENQLYLADFIQLGWFFFEKYTTRPLNQNSIQELRRIVDEKETSEEKLKSFLETYEAKSNWERYFAEKIEVDRLNDKWQELYGYRNCVAHAKRMSSKEFEIACLRINEVKTAFEKCLDHIDDVEMTEEEAEAVQEVAKETISRPQKQYRTSWGVQYPGVISGLSALGLMSENLVSQADLSGISSGILEMADKQKKMLDQYNLGTSSLLVGEKNASQFQGIANSGELLLRAMEPYQTSMDALRIGTESLYKVPDYLGGFGIDGSGTIRMSDLGLTTEQVKKMKDPKENAQESESKENDK